MIVLLNMEQQKITLYRKEGAVDIPFVQAVSLYDYIDNDNVLYVTNAIETNAADIINMIRDMGVAVIEDALQDTGIKYLHGISDGTIYIDETLKFEGPFDCKVIDQQMAQVIHDSPILQNLIKHKKIEIVGERKRVKIMGEFKKFQAKQLDKQQLIDAQSDDIILKEKVADWDGTIGGSTSHADAIPVDIGKTGRIGAGGGVGPSFNTMSELLNDIEGLEG